MKKVSFLLLLSIFVALLFASSVSAFSYPNGTKAKAGDILVTDDAAAKGITGHVAIVTDSNNHLEIKGPGYNPDIYSFKK
ncbi:MULTISPECIES: CHAP domain-containing protein [Paraliobacillus]|uniref:CHAP domain-containing protein n=1 Tax=Paraliobacillus TaxID=200903 RepID=UPI000DD3EDEA|nr:MULTISPECIES: CHAP domain-containing protein [Paraliobacillus]